MNAISKRFDGLALVRILVGLVFLYSGWEKVARPVEQFIAVIHQYRLFPAEWESVLAQVVSWSEFVFGSFLLLGFMIRVSASVIAILLVSFMAMLSRSLWLGLPIAECGCFGSLLSLTPFQAILLDSFLFLMTVTVLISQPRAASLDGWLHR